MTRSECDLRVIRDLLARHVPDREVWAFSPQGHGLHRLSATHLTLVIPW